MAIIEKSFSDLITFSRASKDWDWNGNEYGIDEPVLTDKGLLVSGARTNLMGGSKALDYPLNRLTKTEEGDGFIRFTAQQGTTRDSAYVWPNVSSLPYSTGVYCLSIEVDISGLKQGTYFRLLFNGPAFTNRWVRGVTLRPDGSHYTEGDPSYSAVEHIGGHLYRVSISANLEVVGERAVIFGIYSSVTENHNIGGSYVDVRKLQLEEGITPTPHVPIEGSQATVAAVAEANAETLGARTLLVDLEMVRSGAGNDAVYLFSWSESRATQIPNDGFLIGASNSYQNVQLSRYRNGAFDSITIPVNWENVRKIALTLHSGKTCISVDGDYAEMSHNGDMLQFARYVNLVPTTGRQSMLTWVKAVTAYKKTMNEQQLRGLTS